MYFCNHFDHFISLLFKELSARDDSDKAKSKRKRLQRNHGGGFLSRLIGNINKKKKKTSTVYQKAVVAVKTLKGKINLYIISHSSGELWSGGILLRSTNKGRKCSCDLGFSYYWFRTEAICLGKALYFIYLD